MPLCCPRVLRSRVRREPPLPRPCVVAYRYCNASDLHAKPVDREREKNGKIPNRITIAVSTDTAAAMCHTAVLIVVEIYGQRVKKD